MRPSSSAIASAVVPAAVAHQVDQLSQDVRRQLFRMELVLQRGLQRQASQQFGLTMTSAAGAIATGAISKDGDWHTPAVMAAIQAVQLLWNSEGRALTATVETNPWSTLIFVAAALLSPLGINKLKENAIQGKI